MCMRLGKWFRSSRVKSGGCESSPNIPGSLKGAAGIHARIGVDGKSPSPQVAVQHQESIRQDQSVADADSPPMTPLPSVSQDRMDDDRASDLSLATVPTMQTSQHVDMATQTPFHATALSWSPIDHPQKSFLVTPNPSSIYDQRNDFVQRPAVSGSSRPARRFVSHIDTKASLSPHYAAGAGSEESLTPSVISSSDAVTDEESEVEEDGSCGGIFLDPSSMRPPDIDRMLAFLVPSRQSHLSPLVSQNTHDATAFLSADLDLGSLSEAWTRSLQTPVESST